MHELSDMELVGQYARGRSEAAFARLVERHVNLVHSTAMRFTSNPDQAQEITQAVFIVLARKAAGLKAGTVLPGWLYQTARLTAANLRRREQRRQRLEQEAYTQATLLQPTGEPEAWKQMAPLVDDALGRLGEIDRNAVILRYFQNRPPAEVASALQLSEEAGRKRISRALEKLRKLLSRQGVVLSTALIAAALEGNAVQAAPAGMTVSAVTATSGGAVAGSAAGLAEATVRWLAWARLEVAAGFGLALAVTATLAGGVLWRTGAFASLANHGSVNAHVSPEAPSTNQASGALAEEAAPAPRDPFSMNAMVSLDTPPGGLWVQPDGRILVGASLGGFYVDPGTGHLGQFKRCAFRLNADGSYDPSFCSQSEVRASDASRAHVTGLADGRIFLSGLFDTVDGQARPGYALLRQDGAVDANFIPWRGSTNVPARTFLPGGVYPAAALEDGAVAVLSGSVEGKTASYPLTAYRLSPTGEWVQPKRKFRASLGFSPPYGLAMALTPLGFWTRKPILWAGTFPGNRHEFHFPAGHEYHPTDIPFDAWDEPPTGVDAAPVLDALFEEVPLELCRYAARLPDGGAVLAIRTKFNDGNMMGEGGFMRFTKDWTPDFTFTNHFGADLRSCLTLKRYPDGKLLVAGVVGTMNGEAFPGLVRLNEDGSTDHSFRCETGTNWDARVMDLALQPDGHIVICGFFRQVNGIPCQHLARLNTDGSLDQSFKHPFVSLRTLNEVRFPVHHDPMLAEDATQAGASHTTTAVEESIVILSVAFNGDSASLHFKGRASTAYTLQAKDSLGDADWKGVITSTTDAAGNGAFRDAEARAHPMRFYRVSAR